MAPYNLLLPTTAALSDAVVIPFSNPTLRKTLSKFSRSSLLEVVLQWLQPKNQRSCAPYLFNPNDPREEDSIYPASHNFEELAEIYEELGGRKGAKTEVIDRIMEGDWRHGLSLRQLAMLELRYLEEHPSSLKWTALKLTYPQDEEGEPLKKRPKSSQDPIPQFSTSTFLRNLQAEISPAVKAHYSVHRPAESYQLPMTVVRIYMTETPYKDPRIAGGKKLNALATPKTIFVAFPDSCPYVYVSSSFSNPSKDKSSQSNSHDTRFLTKLVIESIPKALSHQHHRYQLQTTRLSSRSLPALLSMRGNSRSNGAQGVFSIFADSVVEDSPLNVISPDEDAKSDAAVGQNSKGKENTNPYPTPENSQISGSQQVSGKKRRASVHLTRSNNEGDADIVKRRRLIASNRFGSSATDAEDGKGLDRFEVRVEESLTAPTSSPQPDNDTSSSLIEPLIHSRSEVRLTFNGTHVFAGMRALVEMGIVNGEKMPRWMTGEEGVSVGVVRDGKMLGRHY